MLAIHAFDMEIRTPRFVLREFTPADEPAFAAYHADPRMAALYDPEECTAQSSAELIRKFRQWRVEQPRRNFQLAIVHGNSPATLIGCAGLRTAESAPHEAEAGIELAPAFWGRYKVAIEIGHALLDFGFGNLHLSAITGTTVSGNSAIQRFAKWFGAEVASTEDGASWMSERGWNTVHWRITRDRWTPYWCNEIATDFNAITFTPVSEADFEELAGLRVAAMKDSLERVGRFDPARARERLRNAFYPAHTEFIMLSGERIGFYTLRPMEARFHLDHLYIHPAFQGRGIGSVVMGHLLAKADTGEKAITLGALRGSPSNHFYLEHGFTKTAEDEWDVYYRREPGQEKVER